MSYQNFVLIKIQDYIYFGLVQEFSELKGWCF